MPTSSTWVNQCYELSRTLKPRSTLAPKRNSLRQKLLRAIFSDARFNIPERAREIRLGCLFVSRNRHCGHPEVVFPVCLVVVLVARDALSLVRLYATRSRARCYDLDHLGTASILFFAASGFPLSSGLGDPATRRRSKAMTRSSSPASGQAKARIYAPPKCQNMCLSGLYQAHLH